MTELPTAGRKPGEWYPGMKSPNPAGRPPGQNKQTQLIAKMMDEASGILDAMIAKAQEGDPSAAALVLSRILPALRSESQKVQFDLDPTLPLTSQVEQVLAAIAGGQIAPDVGRQIIEAISALGNLRAVEDLESRLTILEGKAI